MRERELKTESEKQSAGILIMGIGNLLMGDEGLGVHFAHLMEQETLPPRVDVVEGGTAGFQLMGFLDSYPHIIMVDATLDGRPAGTIRAIHPRFSSDYPASMSTHDIGLKDLISGLNLLGKQPDVHLFVVSVETLQPMHIGLSPEVEAAMPVLKQQVLDKVRELLDSNQIS